jgi:hypothetical protein
MPLQKPPLLVGVQAGTLVVDGDDLLVGQGGVQRIKPDGTVEPVARVEDERVALLAPTTDALYFASHARVFRVARGAHEATLVVEGPKAREPQGALNQITALAADGDDVWFSVAGTLYTSHKGEPLREIDEARTTGPGALEVRGPQLAFAVDHELRTVARAGGDVVTRAKLPADDKYAAILDVQRDGDDTWVLLGDEKHQSLLHVTSRVPAAHVADFESANSFVVDGAHLWVADRKQGLVQVDKASGAAVVVDARPATNVVQTARTVAWIALEKDTVLVQVQKATPSAPAAGPVTTTLTCADGLFTACVTACHAGDGAACEKAGSPLVDGRGGLVRDMVKGTALLEKGCGAKTASAHACSIAGLIIENGLQGVKKDAAKGKKLKARACSLDATLCK